MKRFVAIVGILACGCATARHVEYPFDSEDEASVPADGLNPRELRWDQYAVLLVPRGVATAEGRTSPDAGARPVLMDGGQLRVVPGLRTLSFTAKSMHEDGEEGRVSWTLTQAFARGKQYELRVVESDDNVEWTVALKGRWEHPNVHPVDPPLLPLGFQADGSLVVAGEEQHGIRAIQISAPLFACPADSPGVVESTLTAPDLVQACAADDPDLVLDASVASWSFERVLRFEGALSLCAQERFGAARAWKHPSLNVPELCSRALGGDWQLPTRGQARQISYLARTARPQDGKSRSPLDILGRLYAASRRGIEAVEIENSAAAAGWDEFKEAELRCIRPAMAVAPAQPAGKRCPTRTTPASGSAGSRSSPQGPR